MRVRCGFLGMVLLLTASAAASAASIHVLHAFDGTDGRAPTAALVPGDGGMLYGTTFEGGTGCNIRHTKGCGVVFSLAPDGTYTILHQFQGDSDGIFPGAMVRDAGGNLFGVTQEGGRNGKCVSTAGGCGVLFKIAPGGAETIVHTFMGGTDGSGPSGLIIDGAGNLYGVTFDGGEKRGKRGFGTVYEVASDGTYTILYAFKEDDDGQNPIGNLAMDGDGNLYGVTELGTGTVFKLAPGGIKTTLHVFGGTGDGAMPVAGPIIDAGGNLYGTTYLGGAAGHGTVFKVDAGGTESVLYSFQGGADGSTPQSGLILDGSGNLFGSTQLGGRGCMQGCGTVFVLAPGNTKTILRALRRGRDGAFPVGGLYLDGSGNLFGTANWKGPSGEGTVFRITGF